MGIESKKVIKLLANWHQCHNGVEAGENYDTYELGKPRVDGSVIVSIEENEPRNGMQLHNFVITFDTGRVIKVFNPNYVEYENVNNPY